MYNLSLAKAGALANAEKDASLVKATRRDPAAFATLYRRYVTPVYRYLSAGWAMEPMPKT